MYAVCMLEIVHNSVKTGELKIDQNSSDTVIYAVPKNILKQLDSIVHAISF